MHNIAVVDCGTNSVRLLIVDPKGNEMLRDRRTTRLGESLGATGALSDASLERTGDALRAFHQEIRQFAPALLNVVATSAVRDASNSGAFIDIVEKSLAVVPEIIDGRREGELTYRGATANSQGKTVVIDIGGGSTEIIAGQNGEPTDLCSIDVGCVRLSERFFTDAPVPEETLLGATEWLQAEFDKAAIPKIEAQTAVIGVAGTISTLASMQLGLTNYSRGAVEGVFLRGQSIRTTLGELTAMSLAELENVPGSPRGRADIIVAGTFIFSALLDRLGIESCRVSEKDISDGLAQELSPVSD